MTNYNLFKDGYLDEFLESRKSVTASEIKRATSPQINDPGYIMAKSKALQIDPLILNWEKVDATSKEKQIHSSQHQNFSFIHEDQDYVRQVFTYHIPFSGSRSVLSYTPNPSLLWSEEVVFERNLESESIGFEIINFGDIERVKREFDGFKQKMTTQLGHITNQVNAFNEGVEAFVTECVNARKKDLEKQKTDLTSLGVPIRE